MKASTTALLAALLIPVFAVQAAENAAQTIFVHKGDPVCAVEQGRLWRRSYTPWKRVREELVGEGATDDRLQCKMLVGGKALRGGTFRVEATLRVNNLSGSNAAFIFDNRNHFVFCDKAGRMVIEGPLFDDRIVIGPTAITEDETFRFSANCRDNQLEFQIDGKKAYAVSLPENEGRSKLSNFTVALSAGRGTVAVREFIISGDTLPLTDAYSRSPSHQELLRDAQRDYYHLKIPALLTAADGTLLAFCEARHKAGDSGDIDLILTRSTDGGESWSPYQIVWDDGPNTCGNPCPVLDQETGVLHLLMTWNNGKDSGHNISRGKGIDTRRVFVAQSHDAGRTWSKPRDITEQAKAPRWTWYATGPGVGIQLARGEHKRRLVIPCDHNEPGYGHGSHVIFSDDHGQSWQYSHAVKPDCNECQVAELPDGTLLLNMRSYAGKACRAVSVSNDGGATWTKVHHDQKLVEPVCQAALIALPPTFPGPIARPAVEAGADSTSGTSDAAGSGGASPNGQGILLFSNPAHPSERIGLTVRLSRDGGQSWPVSRLLWKGPAGYSSLAWLPGDRIGCLYEGGVQTYQDGIYFDRFPADWLTTD